jgi:O-antigen/teichoic acid export membrane protein
MGVERQKQARTPGLGAHSTRGMAYLLAGTTSSILINFVAQIALSYLLDPKDLGVVGLAYTVAVFIQLFEQGGVGDLLVQRRTFRGWAIPGFWLALLLGITSCVAILIAAPIAAAVYRNHQLMWVLFVLAPASIPNALAVVPRAQLARQLRFRALAAVNLASLTIKLSLTVLFAALGFGPFSYVVPVPITNALIAAF